MKVFFSNDGSIEFLSGSTINRNTLNRKKLEVTIETALTAYESLWVQFGNKEDYDDETANVLEPIRLEKVEGSANRYIKLIPKEVVTTPGQWYMVLAVRKYSPSNSDIYAEQLTSEQVSFLVGDNFPVPDDGFVSNASMESYYHDTVTAATAAIAAKEAAKEYWENYKGLYGVDSETTEIDYAIENNVDKSFTAEGITRAKITIPADISHGYQSGVNIKAGESGVTFELVNDSSYEIKYIRNGYGTDSITELTAKQNSLFSFFCDGINVYCILAEV